MFSLGYKPLINKPTRITAYSSTLFDNIFTSDLDFKHKSGIVISDHLPIITSCNSIKRLCTSSLRSYKRNMLNKDKFIEEVKNTDWDFAPNSIDVNGSYDNFIDLILNSLDRHCPYESKIIKIKKH